MRFDREQRRGPRIGTPQRVTERLGVLLGDEDLEERRGVEIEHLSARRAGRRGLLRSAGTREGPGEARPSWSSRVGPVPAARSAPAPPTDVGGTRTATRAPRSVMPTLSPSRTRRMTAEECCWSSRIGTVCMCVERGMALPRALARSFRTRTVWLSACATVAVRPAHAGSAARRSDRGPSQNGPAVSRRCRDGRRTGRRSRSRRRGARRHPIRKARCP